MEVAKSLPGDVLQEIFSRLPMRARLRCEAVSKDWQHILIRRTALLTTRVALDSGFILYDGSTKRVLFYRLGKGIRPHLQDSLALPNSSQDACGYMGLCNGFFFFSKLEYSNPFHRKISYLLYNPVTKHLTTLPPLPPLADCNSFRFPPLRDYNIDPYPLGIGFAPDHINPETNHYKFLVLFDIPYHPVMSSIMERCLGLRVAIFNSKTGEWKTKLPSTPMERLHLGAATLYCRGSLYWLRKSSCLIVFCMKTEIFRLLSLPMVSQKYGAGVLWESDGKIHYCQFSEIEGLCIWVLENYPARSEVDHTWRKIYCVILPQAIGQVPNTGHGHPNHIIDVCGFNEHLQILLLRTSLSGFVWYNITTKKMFPFSPLGSPGNLIIDLSFTYNNMELPDINEIVDKQEYSATVGTSRKRRRA